MLLAMSVVCIQTIRARTGFYSRTAVRAAAGGEDWKMFRHDTLRTGRSSFHGVASPAKKWVLSGVTAYSSPVIGTDGTVYFGSEDRNVYAVNADGSKKWSFATGNKVRSTATIAADGTIYIGSNDGNLYALNADGTKSWSFPTGGSVYSSPVIGTDGTIYVGSYKGYLYALNPDGTQKWAFATGSIGWSSPAIAPDGTIYIGSSDTNVYAVNPDGTQKWVFVTGDAIDSSPAIGTDGTVYIGSSDGNLYAINPDGTQQWAFSTTSYIDGSPAIGSDGTIFIGSSDGNLYAVNADGTQKWAYATVDSVDSSPAVDAAGTVYVGSGKYMYAVDSGGTKVWSYLVDFTVSSSPSIGADGTVYFGAYAVTLGSTSTPIVNITTPTSSGTYKSGAAIITLAGTAAGQQPIASVSWMNDANGKTGSCTGTASWSAIDVPLKAGTNNIKVTAFDTAGNQGTGVIVVSFADGIAPTVTITTPGTNPYNIGAATVDLAGTASDDNGVKKVTWSNATTGLSGTCTGTSSWSVAGLALNAGANSITVTAYDAAGNKGTASISVVFADTIAPTVTLTTPNTNPYSTDAKLISIAGTSSDDNGVISVKWSNSRGGSGSCIGTTDWSYNDIPLKIGANVITVTAIDSFGNKGTATLTVNVNDVTAPVVTFTTPVTNPFTTNTPFVSIAGTASDDAAVTSVKWSNTATGKSWGCTGLSSWSVNNIPLNPGANVINITASDAAGNESVSSITVNFVDIQSPVVTITSPSSTGSFNTTSKSITVAGTSSDDAGVSTITWSNDRGGNGVCSGKNSWTAYGIALEVGVNVITVTGSDASGNNGKSVLTVTLTDASSPTVKIVSPTVGSNYVTDVATVGISGTASDDIGVKKVTWSNIATGQSGDCTGTSSWAVAGIALNVGANMITITAYDDAGNQGTKSLSVVFGDSIAPKVTLVTPSSNPYSTSAKIISIAGTASDNVGVKSLQWSNSRGGSGNCSGTTEWSYNDLPLQIGANIITITALDAAGNKGTTTLTINVTDVTVPVVTITTPNTNPFTTNTPFVSMAGTASDDAAVTSVKWSNTATGKSSGCTGLSSWSVNSIPLNLGANVINITAYDAAGNQAVSSITVNYVDNGSPVVKITSPSSTGVFTTSSNSITVAGTASDDAGVTTMKWSNDRGGNGICSGTTSWTASGIALKSGQNVITVTAGDASGNIGKSVLTVTLTDATRPTVKFLMPTSSSTYLTDLPTVDISGTASDNVGVTSVNWANSTGGSGTCAGTDTWSMKGIPLQVGMNVITVSATDGSANTSTATLKITRDETAGPVITISIPTTDATYSTNNPTLSISGTASDEVAVSAVSWANSRGGAGVCSGTANWNQSGIVLMPGKNVITISGSNPAKKTGSGTLIVYYYDTVSVKWTKGTLMVSLPIIPSNTDPKPIVGFKSNAWFAYDNSENKYAVYPDAFTYFSPVESTPGRGFWAKFDGDVSVPTGVLPDQSKAATIHLVPGWNLIGQPFVTPVKWDLNSIMVQEAGEKSVALGSAQQTAIESIAWGWTQNSTDPNTGSYYLVYDSSIYPSAVDNLAPWQAYWVIAYRECDLILPSPAQ